MSGVAVVVCLGLAQAAAAGDLGAAFGGISASVKSLHNRRPATPCDPDIERLAAEIDWLEDFIDCYGSIVAKHPDVWGQSRLTRHREEYEEQLRRRLGDFEAASNAAIRRSDQAFLGMAMALEAATDRRRGSEYVQVPDVTSNNNVLSTIGSLIPSTNEQVGRSDPVVVARTAPFEMPKAAPGMQFEDAPISLEPTLNLDHLSRYLNHLQELRRINEGDDIADSPGYSLNLVRIPVSVVPGKQTRKGHGAAVTMSVEPYLGEDLLPTTFRSLVINDLVDVIAPSLTWCVNDRECVRWAATIASGVEGFDGGFDGGMDSAMRSLAARIPTNGPSTAPSVKSRRARMPIPFSQLVDTAGVRQIAILIHDARTALENDPAAQPCIGYVDVRNYLSEELDAAYDFLSQDRQQPIWMELCQWNLAEAVRSRRVAELERLRVGYFSLMEPDVGRTTTAVLGWAILLESAVLNDRLADDMRESATASGRSPPQETRGPFYGPDPSVESRLAFNEYVRIRWPIRVFALDPVADEQTVEDSFARRRELQIAMAMAFASGRIGAQALARYTRRLETEMATLALNKTAVGFVHGNDTFGWRFYPRVQTPPTRGTFATVAETLCGPSADADLAARQLEPGQRECTAIVVMPSFVPYVTFTVRSHWFSLVHPRQTKPSMQETVLLSRSVKAMQASIEYCSRHAHLYRDAELSNLFASVAQLDRELPTQFMRAQIPYENTAGGFELFNTGITDLAPELIGWYGPPGIDPTGTTSLFLIGRGFSVHDTNVIAGGRRVPIELISRELLRAEIPPGVRSIQMGCRAGAAIPVVARRPRAGATHVMPAGGWKPSRRAQARVARATEPLPAPEASPPEEVWFGDGEPVDPACGENCNRRESVDIHLATPYGVSSHLLVPVVRDAAASPTASLAFADGYRLRLSFTASKTSGSRTETARIDEYFESATDAIVIRVPDSFIPPSKGELAFTLTDTAGGTIAATFGITDVPFDARAAGYRLGGQFLRNFIGDTSRPATDKTLRGAMKPYLDHLLSEGRLAEDGESVTFTLTAAIAAGQQEVPIAGSVTIEAVRRGKTVVEPPAPNP